MEYVQHFHVISVAAMRVENNDLSWLAMIWKTGELH